MVRNIDKISFLPSELLSCQEETFSSFIVQDVGLQSSRLICACYVGLTYHHFAQLFHIGLFSDILNYVLRISKESPLTPVSSDADSEKGVVMEAGGDKVKVKQKSFIRRKKTIVRAYNGGRTDVGMVCVECFKFLKALAKGYSEVQERYMFC